MQFLHGNYAAKISLDAQLLVVFGKATIIIIALVYVWYFARNYGYRVHFIKGLEV